MFVIRSLFLAKIDWNPYNFVGLPSYLLRFTGDFAVSNKF